MCVDFFTSVLIIRTGRYLVTGNQDGSVSVYDLTLVATSSKLVWLTITTSQPPFEANYAQHHLPRQDPILALEAPSPLIFAAHKDAVNGIRSVCIYTRAYSPWNHSLHPTLPLLATSSGQRRFALRCDYESDGEGSEALAESFEPPYTDNSVALWWSGRDWAAAQPE